MRCSLQMGRFCGFFAIWGKKLDFCVLSPALAGAYLSFRMALQGNLCTLPSPSPSCSRFPDHHIGVVITPQLPRCKFAVFNGFSWVFGTPCPNFISFLLVFFFLILICCHPCWFLVSLCGGGRVLVWLPASSYHGGWCWVLGDGWSSQLAEDESSTCWWFSVCCLLFKRKMQFYLSL